MLFPYNRLYDLFQHIRQNSFSTSKKLSVTMNVSERTIRSDITLLNDVLSDYGAKISLKRKNGYYLEIVSSSPFSGLLELLKNESNASYSLDSQENRLFLLIHLLLNSSDYMETDYLAEQLYISRITLTNYLKILTSKLDTYGLELISKSTSGFKIIGEERKKRSCMADLMIKNFSADTITSFTRDEIKDFPGIDLYQLKSIISIPLSESDLSITDLNLKKLVLHAAVSIARLRLGFPISVPENIEYISPIKQVLDYWITHIQDDYHLVLPVDEGKYLYLHLMSNCDCNTQNINIAWLQGIVVGLINIIYDDFSIDLRVDDVLLKELTRHLQSILRSKSLNIEDGNPMLNVIKSHFPLPFEIALTSVKKAFLGTGYLFTEDDIAYVCLHIGAAMERFFAGHRDKRKALLFCSLGASAARMLETMLEKYFQDSLIIQSGNSQTSFSQLKEADFEQNDFLISTVSSVNSPIPVVSVSFPLTSQDIETVSRMINSIAKTRSKKLLGYFQEELFLRIKTPCSKTDILRQMSGLLEQQGFVPADFFSKVLEREGLGKTSMNDLFALPHPYIPCSNSTHVAVAILDSPVKWSKEETAQLVFLLSLRFGEEVDLDSLYRLFTEIMNNLLLCKRLLKAFDFQNFTDILGEYL